MIIILDRGIDMAIVCTICGKKQSGFIQDLPLSYKYIKQRICTTCDDEMKNTLSQSETSQDEYTKAYSYFQLLIDNNIPTTEAIEVLYELRKNCEKNISIVIKEDEEKHIHEQEKRAQEEKYDNFLMTTGYNFEGFEIVKYNKVICEQVVLGTGFLSEYTASWADFFGVESKKFENKLNECREICTRKLIDKAMEINSNAIIGIDFDYTMFAGNIIGVIINGTAVNVNERIS